tara:strand:+ start:931 stop:1392 length:462 start_codon:yes stop_codon:yes gene_type:complete
MDLMKLIKPDVCCVPLKSSDRQGIIRELVEHLGGIGEVDNVDAITEIVWEREMQRTTGIGEGLAVPHGRCPSLSKLVLAMGIPPQPVDFQSYDRKPVEFVVLVLSPADAISDHVQVLGAISRLMGDRSFRTRAIASDSNESLSSLFLESLSKL